MSFHRVMLAAIAAIFTVAMTSMASACGGWSGCGGGWSGCAGWAGGCGATVAPTTTGVPVTTYVRPIAPAPIWVGGCGCGSYRGLLVAPQPIYQVNQGPEYTGPAIMEPYRTYTSETAYAPTEEYPYIGRHPYVGPRYAYRAHEFRPHVHGPHLHATGPLWHTYPAEPH